MLLILMTLTRATVNNTRGVHPMTNPLTLAKKTSYSELSSKRWPNMTIASTRAITHQYYSSSSALSLLGHWVSLDVESASTGGGLVADKVGCGKVVPVLEKDLIH